MPAISVIVPVHNVEDYVADCLHSILDQKFEDVEVIVVDDASTDGSAGVVEDVIAGHDNVRFVRLQQNVGLGHARNEGLKLATGTYLMFVDSDDYLDDGSLKAIYDRLEFTGADVVVFDYAKAHLNGDIRRNRKRFLLQADVPDVFDLHAHPELVHLLMVVWNKAYRRDFIERLGLEYYTGYYEDLPWTYPVLLAAQRITLLDRVCYYYRMRPTGNILGTSSRKHFDLFDQYRRVFAFLDQHAELDEWRPLLLQRMLQHLTFVLNQGDARIPAGQRKAFVEATAEAARELGAGAQWPADLTVEQRLMRQGSYRGLELLRIRNRVLGPIKRVVRAVQARARRLKTSFNKAAYRVARRLPLDPNLVVFYAYWGRGLSCNPAAIYTKMGQVKPEMKGVWIVNRSAMKSMPPGVDSVVPGSLQYYLALARATYFIGNVGFPSDWTKRKGQVQVMTHHGTALKSMGLDLRQYPVAARAINFAQHMKRVSRWDFSIASSSYSDQIWRRAYPGTYEDLLTGQPRNDLLANATEADVKAVRDEFGIGDDKIVVLYTPTFRDWEREDEVQLDLDAFAENLGEEFVVLARSHYYRKAAGVMQRFTGAQVIDVSNYPDVQPLCLAADILLTDYSSISFDYAVLARPIVTYAHDWDLYVKLRGVYFDLLQEPPGAVAQSEAELVDIFVTRAYESPEARQSLLAFRKKFCEFEDGRASERVIRRVLMGEKIKKVTSGGEPPLPAVAPQPPGTVSRGARAATPQSA